VFEPAWATATFQLELYLENDEMISESFFLTLTTYLDSDEGYDLEEYFEFESVSLEVLQSYDNTHLYVEQTGINVEGLIRI